MSDLIDRQEAVDALERYSNDSDMPYEWHRGIDAAEEVICAVPSAEPEYDMIYCQKELTDDDIEELKRQMKTWEISLLTAEPEIIRCKDCKYFERDIQRSWGTYNGCGVWTDDGNEIEVKPDDYCSYAVGGEE